MGEREGAVTTGRTLGVVASIAVLIGTCLGLAGTAAASRGAATAPDLVHVGRFLGVTCVPAAGGTVRARVKVRMVVVNYHGVKVGDWAKHMKLKARLIPTTPGINLPRSWKEVKTEYLTQDKRHVRDMWVSTDTVSPRAAWRVQIRAVWDRPFPHADVVMESTVPFDASCGANSGMSLPAAPALPSANG